MFILSFIYDFNFVSPVFPDRALCFPCQVLKIVFSRFRAFLEGCGFNFLKAACCLFSPFFSVFSEFVAHLSGLRASKVTAEINGCKGESGNRSERSTA